MTSEEKAVLAEKRKKRNEAKLEYKRKLREKKLIYGYADKDGNYQCPPGYDPTITPDLIMPNLKEKEAEIMEDMKRQALEEIEERKAKGLPVDELK